MRDEFELSDLLRERVELIIGDICSSESDVIVNSCNRYLDKVSGGVNLAIHSAAGQNSQY